MSSRIGDAAPLDADRIQNGVRGSLVGREVIVVEEATSTNDVVVLLATPNTPEGLVVFAETQTRGRGQRGNRWHSASRQGLWFSILLRPRIALADSPRLTAWLAREIARTVQAQLGLPASVKPPNDIQIGNRKVAGVLVEMRAVAGADHIAIAGVGLNVNQREQDFPDAIRGRAASLAMFIGADLDRERIAIAVLRALDDSYGVQFG